MTRGVRVAVLGGGSWGTTVASLAANNAQTILWARSADSVASINEQHENRRYLKGLTLHSELRATTSVEEAVADADVLVTGVPSQALRETLEMVAPVLRPGVPVVNLAKGLEQSSGKRMTEVINEMLPGHPAGLLSGPNLAREVLEGYAAAAVIAMADQRVAESLQQLFASRVFRVYTNTDVLGCELGGTLKNVVAIAAGLADGLGVGDNTRALVITRGLAEMTRLGSALGAQPRTFAGLTGLGDLMATCLSPLSRNRRVGEGLAKGRKLDQVIRDLGMVAEGVKTTPAVIELAHEAGVAVPIAEEVNAVLRGERSAGNAYRGLRRVPPTSELHGLA